MVRVVDFLPRDAMHMCRHRACVCLSYSGIVSKQLNVVTSHDTF